MAANNTSKKSKDLNGLLSSNQFYFHNYKEMVSILLISSIIVIHAIIVGLVTHNISSIWLLYC